MKLFYTLIVAASVVVGLGGCGGGDAGTETPPKTPPEETSDGEEAEGTENGMPVVGPDGQPMDQNPTPSN